jgi:hypothetical protein
MSDICHIAISANIVDGTLSRLSGHAVVEPLLAAWKKDSTVLGTPLVQIGQLLHVPEPPRASST